MASRPGAAQAGGTGRRESFDERADRKAGDRAERAYRTDVGRNDAALNKAYHAGRKAGGAQYKKRRGAGVRRPDTRPVDAEVASDPDHSDLYAQGVRDAYAEERRASAGQVTSSAMSGAASDGAGFVLGLLAWALALAYFRGGNAEVRAWLAAKFLNRTSAATGQPQGPALPDARESPTIGPLGPLGPQRPQGLRVQPAVPPRAGSVLA